jgi:hypothetical protein
VLTGERLQTPDFGGGSQASTKTANGHASKKPPTAATDQDNDSESKPAVPQESGDAMDVDATAPTARQSPALRAAAPPVPSPAQLFAPLPSSSASRKRSVDSTYSSSSEQAPESGKKSAKRKMAPGSDASSSPLHGQSFPTKDHDDPSLNPILSVPTQWEELHYRPVQVININAPGAKDLIQALRCASTPFILEGYSGWMKFAADWVLPNGALDSEAFLRGLHDIKVPVIEKNYEDTNPIKTYLPLSYYVRNYWAKGKVDYYMHQWQFPLTPKAAKLLCYKCDELPVLGDNLLLYWLDTVRGDNPLQYFFMGQRSTNSRMHQDPGGLDITIAPIVGTKRVTMIHKSAAKIDSVHDQINFHEVNLDKMPLLAFIPAWRVDIQPGQILFMPEGTLHSCENMTACLSYHRFHVDAVNMPGFLASFMAQDSPSINHAEILWNAVHDVMASLEENYHANGRGIDMSVPMLRKLDSMRALRHAARVLSLEEAVPTEDAWDWKKLLGDIDDLLVRIDPTAPNNKGVRTPSTSAKQKSSLVSLVDGDSGDDDDGHSSSRGASASASATSSSATGRPSTSTTSAPVANALAHSNKSLSTHWDDLQLKVGDTIGVQVFERRNKARVLRIATNIELVQIHYVDWGSIYDEFLPLNSLFQRSTRSSKRVPYRKAPKVHESVLAKWGSTGQLYNAIVLKVIRSNACFVHYLKYENDWDQWILPGHIFKKYAKDAAGSDDA